MSDLPKSIHVHEEAPREGFQSEARVIPTAEKIRFIEALAETGVKEIDCVSLVNPKRVPQMADAEQVASGIRRKAGVKYQGLWLNAKGFERARASGIDLAGKLLISASEQFGIHNNNQDRAGILREQAGMLEAYRAAGLAIRKMYIFTAFGCNFEGDVTITSVTDAVRDLLALVPPGNVRPVIYLADTVGWANPLLVKRTLGALRERWPDHPLGLHLHDTRGLGIANAMAGLEMGVAHFDSSCGGLGGCPFAGNAAAAGNIATEELLQLCDESGIETGIDIEAMIDCAELAESIVGHPLPSKVAKVHSVAAKRKTIVPGVKLAAA